jgi:hypothetical protein
VVLHGCETWSLILREEQRLKVFHNRLLRGVYLLTRDELSNRWRRLHNEELHDLFSLPWIVRNIKSRWMRWVGHVVQIGVKRNTYRLLVGRPEEKRPLGRPRCRWRGNIKMD